jgi:hypothetical protein
MLRHSAHLLNFCRSFISLNKPHFKLSAKAFGNL